MAHAPAATLVLDGSPLLVEDVVAVARGGRPVALAPAARGRVAEARATLERRMAGGEALYGINTGFGSLARKRIAPEQLAELQVNLVRSHAAGVGEPLSPAEARAMCAVLAASLARGHSAVRPEVIELLVGMLNAGVAPVIPEVGSVGASGDLAPLSHLALVLMGEGEAWHRGERLAGGEALRRAGLASVALAAKEGLALINGTHFMCAIGALAMHDIGRILDHAVRATAMSIDACRASDSFLDARIHAARNQPGQAAAAAAIARELLGTQIVPSHRENDPRVQDPYSFRCAPQVLGAAMDALAWARGVIERELGGVTDNPLVFAEGGAADIVSGGNFHGMPLALAIDAAKMALVPLAAISERRTFWLLSANDPQNPVRPYLAADPGVCSGYMIAQYTAAACCNELQVLSHPASAHNVGTSAGIEDINSMGATGARHLRTAVERARTVIAVELVVMAEGLDYQRPLKSGAGVEALHAAVRGRVARMTADRSPAADIAAASALIAG